MTKHHGIRYKLAEAFGSVARPELCRSKSEPTWEGIGNDGDSCVDSGRTDSVSDNGVSIGNGDNEGCELGTGTEAGVTCRTK